MTSWDEQVGPALSEEDAAALLGVTVDELRTRPLLRAGDRYPAAQFDGDAPVPGLESTVGFMSNTVGEAALLAWFTGEHPELGCSPLAALRDGRVDDVHHAGMRFAVKAGTGG